MESNLDSQERDIQSRMETVSLGTLQRAKLIIDDVTEKVKGFTNPLTSLAMVISKKLLGEKKNEQKENGSLLSRRELFRKVIGLGTVAVGTGSALEVINLLFPEKVEADGSCPADAIFLLG